MKQVFIHKNSRKDKPYTVIWKDTGKTQDVDDVMLFNGEFKRHNGIKGWHGIISDEINFSVITLVSNPENFYELKQIGKLYYPRVGAIITKTAQVVRFLPNKIVAKQVNSLASSSIVKEWCKPWKLGEEEYDDEDDWGEMMMDPEEEEY